MNLLGLDIGGANLKAATHDGAIHCLPFPLWQKPNELHSALQNIAATLCKQPELVAVTMTGELADCFETKEDGVHFIIAQVEAAFPSSLIRIWLTSGEFAEPDDARGLTSLVAAANWHALASWVARIAPSGPALLIDVGSTTIDLIPLDDGFPANRGRTDLERLISGELLYHGVSRTPVCALVHSVQLRGDTVPVAAELFATMKDVHIISGQQMEDANDTATADGRPATRLHSLTRLAHMLCCDRTEVSEAELTEIAVTIATVQQQLLIDAIQKILTAIAEESHRIPVDQAEVGHNRASPTLILSGSGAWLAESAVGSIKSDCYGDVFPLASMYRNDVSVAACAFAVARLAAERCLDDLLPLTVL